MNEERATGPGERTGSGPGSGSGQDADTDEDLGPEADEEEAHAEEAEADDAEAEPRPTSRKRPTKDKAGFVVTDRDRQVIAYAALARYLSTEQLERLFFPCRALKDTRQRLLRLAGEWRLASDNPRSKNGNCQPPYLRRRRFRRFDGDWVEVWTPTDPGYLLAEHVLRAALRVPRVDVSADFLEHSAQLSELFVGLVDPALDPCPRCGDRPRVWTRTERREVFALTCRTCGATSEADATPPHAAQLPFRWTTSENARLPWLEFDKKGGAAQERFIVPDGILELPSRGVRLFLECEMGSNTIVGGATKPNATLAKAERYERYLTGTGKDGRRFYEAAHPDGLRPEVLYLVLTEGRRDAVNVALAAWRKQRGPASAQRALTFDEAVAELRGGAPRGSEARAGPTVALSETDLQSLKTFFAAVMGPLKDARAKARAAGATPPPYPPEADAVSALLRKLSPPRPGSAPGADPDPDPLASRGRP